MRRQDPLSYDNIQAHVENWVEKHPKPDSPVEGGLGPVGLVLTPRSMLNHIQKRTEIGLSLVERWRKLLSKRG